MNNEDIVKFLSYGMTRTQICDYFNVDEPTLCEYVVDNFGITIDQLEKQYKANLELSIYQNLNQWMAKNPKILMYMADRVLGPVENKSTVTVINDVGKE